MESYYGNQLRVVTPYRPGPGHFSRIKEKFTNGSVGAGQWFYCRDLWHNEGKDTRDFLFSHVAGKSKPLAAFIHRFEKTAGVHPFSTFGPTQRKTITWVSMSPWWKTSMRRSLFSLLLRVAHKYSFEKDNFEEALYSIEMTKQSRSAIEYFLSGHTRYKGKMRGWYNQFGHPKRRPDSERLGKLLVLP